MGICKNISTDDHFRQEYLKSWIFLSAVVTLTFGVLTSSVAFAAGKVFVLFCLFSFSDGKPGSNTIKISET